MELVYKKCTSNDVEALIEISKKTFIEAFEHLNKPKDFKNYLKKAFSKKTITKQLSNPDSSFYFCYYKSELAAYFKLNQKEAQNEDFDHNAIELERIYVLDQFQGQGFGSEILKEALRLSRAKKASYLWLGVWEVNLAAIRFYKRHGFIKFGKHPYIIGKDKQFDWLMKKELT